MTAPEDQNGLREALARWLDEAGFRPENQASRFYASQRLEALRDASDLIAGPLASLIAERDAAVAGLAQATANIEKLSAAIHDAAPVLEARALAAEAERDAAVADTKAAEAQNDALHIKLAALAPHGSCACSYDQPGDVCSHHSPALRAAEAEITRLKEGMEARERAVERALTASTEMSAILLMAGEMTAQERRTARAVASGLATKVRSALATLSPKEHPHG